MSNNNQRAERFKWSLDLGTDYVEKHLGVRRIFPITAGAKFPPLINDNLAKASSDPAQIAAWAKRFPGCNWGLSLFDGNLLVADVDTNKAKGKVGQETFDTLDMLYTWPATEIVTTPSGGHHHYYVGPHVMALGLNGFGKDIDSPNYVLIAGCKFDDGTSYKAANDLDAVAAEPWMYDVIKASKTKKTAVANAGEIVVELDQPGNVEQMIDYLQNEAVPSIQGSGGDLALLKAAYYLKDFGISQELGAELLNEHFNPRCEPPWDMDMLVSKMAGAYNYANLSKVGGKTGEADFKDDDATVAAATPVPAGIYNIKTEKYDPPININTPEKRAADKIVVAAIADAGAEFDYGVRPEIDITSIGADLPKLARKVQKIFVAIVAKPDSMAADQVFNREGKLVHLSRNKLPPDTEGFDKNYHVENELLLKVVEQEWLADTLERKLQFYKMAKGKGANARDKAKPVSVGAPLKLTNRMFAIRQDWRYPKIKGTVETPTLRSDGTILDKPGFDKKSGLYFDPGNMVFPPIARYPTLQQRKDALDVLREVLADFPFCDDEDNVKDLSLSVALAMILTGVVRRTLLTAPMFGVDATQANTGKTELAQVVARIMTGRDTAVRNFPTDEHQCKAELAAAFEAGDAMILYDNIDGDKQTVESAALCAALTSERIQARRYGSNSGEDQITALTNSLIGCTGNGLTFEGDMTDDRGLKCTLRTDKKLADRKFTHWPLNEYVIKQRPRLVAACLTILRGHIVDRSMKPGGNFRFQQWRAMVADALVGLGMPDPTLSCARFKSQDPREAAQREVMRDWAKYIGEADVTSTTALPLVRQAIGDALGLPDAKRLTMKAAGKYLRAMTNIPLLGYRLTRRTDEHTKAIHWQAQCIDPASRIKAVSPPTAAQTEADLGFDDAETEFAESPSAEIVPAEIAADDEYADLM